MTPTESLRSPGSSIRMDAHESALAPDHAAGTRDGESWQAIALLAFFAVVCTALVVLYPDSSSADGGTHFLEARWAWREGHRSLLVDVWGRPLFTVLYSLPAQFGYRAGKLFTVALCIACAWQTWRTAQLLRFERAPLVIALLFLQPSFLMVSPDTMTEPLFTLVLIVALRLHLMGRVRIGAVIASLLPLARPEGPFLVALWGLWILFDRREERSWWRRIPTTFLLATGMLLWWLGALAITHDPLWIRHNAPWQWTSAAASRGSFWHYWSLRKEIFGAFLWVPLLAGMVALLVRRRALTLVSAILVIFLLHSTMWALGLLNTEGYARYITCTAPVLALVTLVGWNVFANALSKLFERLGLARVRRPVAVVVSAYVLLYSAWYAAMYVDGQEGSRAAWAMNDTYRWFESHPRPVRQLAWSRAYMPILFDWDMWRNLPFTNDREQNVSLLRSAPSGTLVFWDAAPGIEWYHLGPDDFKRAGFLQLRARTYALYALLPGTTVDHGDTPRKESMYLFYKE
jgi:hypothetical protein